MVIKMSFIVGAGATGDGFAGHYGRTAGIGAFSREGFIIKTHARIDMLLLLLAIEVVPVKHCRLVIGSVNGMGSIHQNPKV